VGKVACNLSPRPARLRVRLCGLRSCSTSQPAYPTVSAQAPSRRRPRRLLWWLSRCRFVRDCASSGHARRQSGVRAAVAWCGVMWSLPTVSRVSVKRCTRSASPHPQTAIAFGLSSRSSSPARRHSRNSLVASPPRSLYAALKCLRIICQGPGPDIGLSDLRCE
jgi:hypothetical protein